MILYTADLHFGHANVIGFASAIFLWQNGTDIIRGTSTFMDISIIKEIQHGNLCKSEKMHIMQAACYMDTCRSV